MQYSNPINQLKQPMMAKPTSLKELIGSHSKNKATIAPNSKTKTAEKVVKQSGDAVRFMRSSN